MSAQQFYQGGNDNAYDQRGYQNNYNQQYAQQNQGYNQGGYPQAPQQSYQPPSGPPQGQYAPQQQAQNQYGMKPSQPYAPPQGPPQGQNYGNDNSYHPESGAPPAYVDTAPFSQANEKTGQRLNPKKRLNDPIFLVLFLASLAGFAVVSGIAIKSFIDVGGLGGGVGSGTGRTGSSVTLDYHTVYLLLIVCALGLALAAVYLAMVRAFTRIIIEVTLALTVILNIGICVYYFIIKYWSGAIIFLVIALLSVFFYWSMRKRIPLAKLLLQVTIDITKHHPSVYFVVLIGLIVQSALSVWYTFTCIAIYVKWTPGSATCTGTSCSSGKVAGLVFYSTFAYLWTSQVVGNVILCTLAGGVFGGWYYYGPRVPTGGLPKRATLSAFIRASTLSLGSIAFGSLIVTILELIRLILQAIQQYEAGQGDTIGAIVACCASCCVGCIEGMIAWFNKYAYIEISLYGKSYIPAAKDTWALLKDRGIDALVNDSLVGTALMWGAYINGFLCAVFGYFYLRFTNPAYNADGQYSAPIILFSFLIGISEGQVINSAIDAGVSTIFVGLGEDPMVLAERSPALFEMIRQTYPRVVEGVPRR
ncbi:protein PNS1 [Kwoniella bestiolae CBS 10118]|uniref:Protein PNS1 n=1 Tax=Kwoniella bestiolae CBS 10118 TaxID=1296100 RepID=A0A1B9G1V8_9TREE|nr:protein PNS1 [Kwoniella bestiolae CBS 10118]OCF25003.1 protein PNS1 [Kwoniella bestiolae CBS 10118]